VSRKKHGRGEPVLRGPLVTEAHAELARHREALYAESRAADPTPRVPIVPAEAPPKLPLPAVPPDPPKGSDLDDAEADKKLHASWDPRPGLVGFLTNNNHSVIGKRYMLTAFVFFALAGVEALVMRFQLARPGSRLVSADQYNQLFTTHGTAMMFLFAVPVMQGLAIYLVPLMIGTRNVVFPRANLFGWFSYLIGGALLYTALALNIGPDTGWFAYVPLSGPEFAPGKRVDIWAQTVTFTEISSLVAAVELIVTIFKLRAPGMSLDRMPLFVWATLATSFMILFAMPTVAMGSVFLALDRLVGTHFFNVAEGGDALLWQHLFWFFGHPEVYIIFIPALGIISTVLGAFCRRPVFGYTALVLSLLATAFIGFGLWVHHMFAAGLPQMGESFFTAASMLIAIPTGIQVFCWIATMWVAPPRIEVPVLWILGFFAIFIVGGLSGLFLASVPIDLQVHDTFFVVAHLHYVLIGGAVFPLLGGLYYWLPKITGRRTSDALGRFGFWLAFVGFNLTFFPMHQLGLRGMPRRVYTYLPETGWATLNAVATAGAVLLGLGVLAFVVNVAWSLRHGAIAGDDPWGAPGLEWTTSSPPPHYGFLRLPTVVSREPRRGDGRAEVVGISTETREVLVTRTLDAQPAHRCQLPTHSPWPAVLALATAVTFIVGIFTPWSLPMGAAVGVIALFGWFWPTHKEKRPLFEQQPADGRRAVELP
jgi:cytochrome c oxidase subunit I+III